MKKNIEYMDTTDSVAILPTLECNQIVIIEFWSTAS